jgi:hypothetical protein
MEGGLPSGDQLLVLLPLQPEILCYIGGDDSHRLFLRAAFGTEKIRSAAGREYLFEFPAARTLKGNQFFPIRL